MKILFYNHTPHVSGAEKVLLMTLQQLDRNEFDPVVVSPIGTLASLCAAAGVPVASIGVLDARFTWRVECLASYVKSIVTTVGSLKSIIKSSCPDLIHANSVRAAVVACFATFGTNIPVLWHVHDVLRRHPFSTAVRWLALLHGNSSIVAVSSAAAKAFKGRLLTHCPRRVPVTVVYNGIELSRFRPAPELRAPTRENLQLTDSQFAVCIVGQITRRKDHFGLLRAFAKIAAEFPNCVLLIIGAPLFNRDHEYLHSLQAESTRLGLDPQVRFLGNRQDVSAILQAVDLLVLNSRSEPFSIVLLEALASATPVLATSVDGVPELIQDDKTGFLVKPNRPDLLANRLRELINSPLRLRQAGARGQRHVQNHFGSLRYSSAIEGIHRALARSYRPHIVNVTQSLKKETH